MGKSSNAPEMPDVSQQLQEQQRVNNEQMWTSLRASRPNQSNPYGSSTWSWTPQFDESGYNAAMAQYNSQNAGYQDSVRAWQEQVEAFEANPQLDHPGPTPRPNTTGTIAPTREQFTTYDAHNRVDFSGPMRQQWNLTGDKLRQTLGLIDPTAEVDLIDDVRGMYSQELADAIYNRTTRLSGQEFDRAGTDLENRLAERGMQVGNEGYVNEMDRFERSKSEHYSDAADRAQIQTANQSLAEAGFTNNARLSEFATNQGFKTSLAQALSGIQSQMSAGLYGGFAPTMNVGSPAMDVAALYGQNYNAQMDQYNADVGSENAAWSTALGVASMFMPALAAGIPATQQSYGNYYNPPNYNLYSSPNIYGAGGTGSANGLYVPNTARR